MKIMKKNVLRQISQAICNKKNSIDLNYHVREWKKFLACARTQTREIEMDLVRVWGDWNNYVNLLNIKNVSLLISPLTQPQFSISFFAFWTASSSSKLACVLLVVKLQFLYF